MTTPQPGWYPNPDGSTDLRYWDGTSWTDQTRPAPAGTAGVAPAAPIPAATPAPAPDPVPPAPDPGEPAPPAADGPPVDPVAHETIQFPPEPQFGSTDTMIFPPDAGRPPAAPPPPVAPPTAAPAPPMPPPPPTVAPPVAPPPPASAGSVPPTYPTPPAYPTPAAGFGAPAPSYYPPAATTPVSSSPGMSVASLVLGLLAAILSLLCGPFTLPLGIAAAVFGFLGINQANKTTPPGPKGMAIAGLILAGVSVLISLLWLVFVGASGGSTSGF